MKTFRKPYWILLTVTAPQLLILLYYFGIHGIVASLLNAEHLSYWFRYGAALSGLMAMATGYALFLLKRRQAIHWLYALLALLGYVVFLYLFVRSGGRMLPFSIPRWMVPGEEAFLLPIGLIMPALMHALLLLVERFTPADKQGQIFVTTVGAVAVPAFWYLMFRTVFPLLQGNTGWPWYDHIRSVLFIVLTVAFMFLLLRLTYLLLLKVRQSSARTAWLVKAPFTILLPLLCLLVYNGAITWLGGDLVGELKFIGDWSHPIYYVLVSIIGVLLTLPPASQPLVRFGAFATKAVLYPFVAYFFVVFLPFFPFAMGALVVLGFGFLLLTPLILFFLHTASLNEDWRALGAVFGRKIPAAAFLAAVAVLPLGLTVTYGMDRSTLNRMLTHVYESDYMAEVAVEPDLDSARRVLATIRTVKEDDEFIFAQRKPYLTTYYQWLVLDNLTLSDRRLSELERIFLGASASEAEARANVVRAAQATGPTRVGGPRITHVETTTARADDGEYYRSRIDLTIENPGAGDSEYATRFGLPLGAWVSDYYLVIDGEKVPGILSEKRSALWLFQQIRDTRRDPGIIYYTSPDELILRVFPFARDESRQTGFELIHREPVTFAIDGIPISLRGVPLPDAETSQEVDVVLVSPVVKAALPRYTRKPYLHFIIDRSVNAAHEFDVYRERIASIAAGGGIHDVDLDGAMVTVANYTDRTFPLDEAWESKAEGFGPQGGFFLEWVAKRALYRNYRQQSDRYPVFVVVTDRFEEAVFTKGMREFEIAMPEGDVFFVLDGDGAASARRFSSPMEPIDAPALLAASRHVLAWPDASRPVAFLPDDRRASLVLKNPDFDVSALQLDAASWENGATLYGAWLSAELNPRGAGRQHHSVITNSFRTHLLTPLTAFLAPENEAQRHVLHAKQQQMLSSMRPLDAGEEHEMAEPPIWVLALLLGALVLLRKRGRRQTRIIHNARQPVSTEPAARG